MGRVGQRPLVVTRDTAQQGINGQQARVQKVWLKENFARRYTYFKYVLARVLFKKSISGIPFAGFDPKHQRTRLVLENLIQERKLCWIENVRLGRTIESCAPLLCSSLTGQIPAIEKVDRDPVGKIDPWHSRSPCSCPEAHPACPRATSTGETDPGERAPMLFGRAHSSHLHASLTRENPLALSSVACGQVDHCSHLRASFTDLQMPGVSPLALSSLARGQAGVDFVCATKPSIVHISLGQECSSCW